MVIDDTNDVFDFAGNRYSNFSMIDIQSLRYYEDSVNRTVELSTKAAVNPPAGYNTTFLVIVEAMDANGSMILMLNRSEGGAYSEQGLLIVMNVTTFLSLLFSGEGLGPEWLVLAEHIIIVTPIVWNAGTSLNFTENADYFPDTLKNLTALALVQKDVGLPTNRTYIDLAPEARIFEYYEANLNPEEFDAEKYLGIQQEDPSKPNIATGYIAGGMVILFIAVIAYARYMKPT